MAPDTNSIVEHFGRLLARNPGAPLVADTHNVATVSDVEQLARGFEQRLAMEDYGPDGLIGLVAPNGPGFLAALLAVRRRQLAALLIDSSTPFEEQSRVARALGAPAVLEMSSARPVGEGDCTVTQIPGVSEPARLPGVGVVKLTSGSTGEPRGIATREGALVSDASALSESMGITPDDRILSMIPMSHSYGLSTLAITALTQGTVLILPESRAPYEPLLSAQKLGATVLPTVPAFLQALLRLSDPTTWPDVLRLVISAGASLPPATAVRFRERFGLPIHVFYGASECGGICYDREGSAGERGTVGTPVRGVEVSLEGTHPDAQGTVVVRSPAVGDRYLPDEDSCLSAGCFRSKDLARWCDGELGLIGRREDWINVGGRKVNPREVEGVLKQMPGIQDVVVFGFSIPDRGGEAVRAIVAGSSPGPSSVDMLSWCRSRLAAHKVPRSLIRVPEVPRTSRGKLDWRTIRNLHPGGETETAGS